MGYASQTEFNVIVKSVGTADLLFKLEENSEVLDEVVVAKALSAPIQKHPSLPNLYLLLKLRPTRGEIMTLQKSLKAFQEFLPLSEGLEMTLSSRGAPNETVYYLDGVEIPNINHFSTQGSAGGPVRNAQC